MFSYVFFLTCYRTLLTFRPAFVLVLGKKMSQLPCLLSLAAQRLSPLRSLAPRPAPPLCCRIYGSSLGPTSGLCSIGSPRPSDPVLPAWAPCPFFLCPPYAILPADLTGCRTLWAAPRLPASLHLDNRVTLHALLSALLLAEGFFLRCQPRVWLLRGAHITLCVLFLITECPTLCCRGLTVLLPGHAGPPTRQAFLPSCHPVGMPSTLVQPLGWAVSDSPGQ